MFGTANIYKTSTIFIRLFYDTRLESINKKKGQISGTSADF